MHESKNCFNGNWFSMQMKQNWCFQLVLNSFVFFCQKAFYSDLTKETRLAFLVMWNEHWCWELSCTPTVYELCIILVCCWWVAHPLVRIELLSVSMVTSLMFVPSSLSHAVKNNSTLHSSPGASDSVMYKLYMCLNKLCVWINSTVPCVTSAPRPGVRGGILDWRSFKTFLLLNNNLYLLGSGTHPNVRKLEC